MGRNRKKNRHLPQCMYIRHGAYYYVREGKWHPLGRDYADALQRYAAFSGPAGTMPDLLARVLAHHKPKVSEATYKQYAVAAKILGKALAEFQPEQVLPRDVAQIKTAMANRPNMANRCLSFLRLAFGYALEWGEVPSNPVIGIRRHAERKRERYITDAEYSAIHAAAGDRLQVIIDLLYLTGQRVVDVLSIRRADLTDAGIQFKQGKTGVRVTVAWNPALRASVERAKRLRGRVSALTLISGRTGKAPDYRTVRDQWERACAAAGVDDAHIHDLRAKALTDAKREGHDAQALAGHSSARMTERYIRLRESPVVAGPGGDYFGQSSNIINSKLDKLP